MTKKVRVQVALIDPETGDEGSGHSGVGRGGSEAPPGPSDDTEPAGECLGLTGRPLEAQTDDVGGAGRVVATPIRKW